MKNIKTPTKRIYLFLAFAILLILVLGVVSAETKVIGSNFDADSWFGRIISQIKFSIYKSGTFTVYGDELGCSKYPDKIVTLKNGQSITLKASDIGKDAAFVNIFRGSPNDGAYSSHPSDSRQFLSEVYLEKTKFTYFWTCDAGAYWNNDCYADYYGCPMPCYSNSDCSSGKTCVKDVISQKISGAGVCKTINPTHTTQVYSCANGIKTSLGGVTYGSTNFCTNPSDSKYLIGTTDQCLSYIPSACSPQCGDNICNGQETCSICPNDCGACSSEGTPTTSCTSSQINVNGICTERSTICTDAGGTKDCTTPPTPTVTDPSVNVIITPISITDSGDNLLTTDSVIKPGNEIKIKFKVKTNEQLGTLENKFYRIEAGVIPLATSNSWGFTDTDKFFSISGGLSLRTDSCCQAQTNIDGSNQLFTKNAPEQTFTVTVQIPDKNTVDQCPSANGPSLYWDSSSQTYIIYIAVKNGCFKDGYREIDYRVRTINVDINNNQTQACVGLLPDGQSCSNDIECCSGVCSGGVLGIGKKCSTGSIVSGNISGTLIKKYPLTREEIGKSTSADLISSACYSSSECGERENYTISCIPVSKLVSDGDMTVQGEKDLFSSGKAIITAGTIGGGAAATFCAIGLATGAWTGGVTTVVGCGIGGALLIVGLSEAASHAGIGISNLFSSELQKAITSGDSAKVGICTAEPKAIDIGAWINKIGGWLTITGNPTWDGIIIIVAGIFILILLFNMLGSKK